MSTEAGTFQFEEFFGAQPDRVLAVSDQVFCRVGPFPVEVGADSVHRLDWYAEDLPTTCEQWQDGIRGRYQAIGRQLRPDLLGFRRLNGGQQQGRLALSVGW